MRRRELLKGLLAVVGGTAAGFRLPFANAADYLGKLFVFVQADGGWDPTSFCDPKANTPGEPVINHWAERDEIREAGNIAVRAVREQRGILREVLPADAGDQRRRRADQLAHSGRREQLERAQLRGLPGDDGTSRSPLRGGSAGRVPELRRLLQEPVESRATRV